MSIFSVQKIGSSSQTALHANTIQIFVIQIQIFKKTLSIYHDCHHYHYYNHHHHYHDLGIHYKHLEDNISVSGIKYYSDDIFNKTLSSMSSLSFITTIIVIVITLEYTTNTSKVIKCEWRLTNKINSHHKNIKTPKHQKTKHTHTHSQTK